MKLLFVWRALAYACSAAAVRFSALLLALSLPLMVLAQDPADAEARLTTPGKLMIIGGALRFDNAEVWQSMLQAATRQTGKPVRIAVIASAAAQPQQTGQRLQRVLQGYGADAYVLDLPAQPWPQSELSQTEVTRQQQVLEQLQQADAVFFSGGDQRRIVAALRYADGGASPVLKAIWALYQRGGLIAGTSAGAAIMSELMFADPGSVLTVMQQGARMNRELAYGLGFIGPDIFVDQHFLIRGRLGRMLAALSATAYAHGLGIDENTALLIEGRRYAQVFGYKGVMLVSMPAAANKPATTLKTPLQIQAARLSYLSHGDKLDLHTWQITPAADKQVLPAQSNPEAGQSASRYADVLANTVVPEMMLQLMDSPIKSLTGLAFDVAAESDSLGFELKLSKTPQSRAFYSAASGMTQYAIIDLQLDLRPLNVAPLSYQVLAK